MRTEMALLMGMETPRWLNRRRLVGLIFGTCSLSCIRDVDTGFLAVLFLYYCTSTLWHYVRKKHHGSFTQDFLCLPHYLRV